MARKRPITAVHVDIARFAFEVATISKDSMESKEKWINDLARCLVMRDPTLHPYGAHLLSEVEEYRKADIERKKAKDSKDSVESVDSQPRAKQSKAKQSSILPAAKRRPARDEIWDTVVDLFRFKPPHPKREGSRIGAVVSFLKQKSATPAEIRRRYKAAVAAWNGNGKFGPEALERNWNLLEHAGENSSGGISDEIVITGTGS